MAIFAAREGHAPTLASVFSATAMAALMFAGAPNAAGAEGMDGSRSSLSAEAVSAAKPSAARVRKEGRLTANGTRAPAAKVEMAQADIKPSNAVDEPADGDASSSVAQPEAAAKPAVPSKADVPVSPPGKLGLPDCLAGCGTPDKPVGQRRAAAQSAAAKPELAKVERVTPIATAGLNCIAGCYGSGMEQPDPRSVAAEVTPATLSTTSSKDAASSTVRVLRGISRKRSYGIRG